jgi:tRNA nucleotidyltransferase (CCA-adding enzyme)
MHKRGTKSVGVFFRHDRINPNTLYSQLRKTCESLKNSIEHYGFKIMKSGFWTNETANSMILYEFEVWKLPKFERRFGPRVDMSIKNQDEFTGKYQNPKQYIEDGRLVVDTKRKFTDALEVIKKIIEEKKGFGKDVKEMDKIEILIDDEILKLEDEGFLKFLDEFF